MFGEVFWLLTSNVCELPVDVQDIRLVGEVFWLLTPNVCGLPIDVQDIRLVGEELREPDPLLVLSPLFAPAPSLVKDNELGELRIGCFPCPTASTFASGPCLPADSFDGFLSESSDIFSILFTSSR